MMAARLADIPSKVSSLFWEYRLGISTRGSLGEDDGGEHACYSTVPYLAIFRILNSFSLTRSDVFVDLGSGKGRTVCCAATYDIERAVGIEDVGELCELSRHNVSRMRHRRAPADIVQGRVQQFDYRQGTVFYLFNPFGPDTLGQVLRNLACGLHTSPRPVRIAYVNPTHEEVLEASGFLVRYDHWKPWELRWPVSFWCARV
jgi:hypothetical protein